MAIKPIWRAMLRSPAGPLLLAAQVALSLMIFANVGYVISVRLETTSRPTGMDVDNIFWITSQGYGKDFDPQRTVKFDLEYLNLLSGVVAAAVSNGEPQTLQSLRSMVSVVPELKGQRQLAVVYQTTEKIVDALGLKLIRGRVFSPDAVPGAPSTTIRQNLFGSEVVITKALAERLFGDSDQALGKSLYFSLSDGGSATVVGIVDLMQAAPRFGAGSDFVYDVVLAPGLPAGTSATYVVRTKAGDRDQVMAKVKTEFESSQPNRYIARMNTLSSTVTKERAEERNGAVIFAALSSFVLAVTMLGLFGFASLAVTSRIKEIGTRRAFGATKGDILRNFLIENWLITTAGLVAGTLLTLAFTLQLHLLLELPRLPAIYLVGAMVLIWVCGLLAALAPALRGASVPPAVATRVA